MDETKRKFSNEFSKTIKSSSTHIILPNSSFHKQISEETAHYSQLIAASNATTVPKLSVQYIAISLNNEQLVNSFCKQMENCNQTASNITKIESFESEKKCLISLPLENMNAMHECDSNSLKINQSITNQRLLISPTDFLTLSEEGMCHKNPAVKKDVNLCSSNIEIIRPNTNCENNFAICLDRYCESPLMLENQKESQLICDDETSCNGRNSRLSETAEDITTDELFATTFGTDQTSSLREVVTPIENENSSNAPILVNKDILITNKNKHTDENILCEEQKELSESIESKPVLTILDRLDADTDSTHCSNSITTSDNSFAFISTQTSTNVSTQTTTTTVLSPLDIKLLQTGIKDSILLANLAAALPSSMTSRQIALQVIREDGTSLVLPLNTKHESNDTLTIKDANSDLPVSTSLLLAEVVNQNESIRPFKCELCNSTFTRLGNYTRHKKIHSYPSKEDQRFRCEICSKSFIQRCDLARHLHIHRGTEPHRCPQCGKGYIRHSDLVTHQRFHNKEKPFSCPHCSKGFCQRGDLNRHLRSIHLQLKPILCSHCHKKFAKEETLLRHINATHRAENSTLN